MRSLSIAATGMMAQQLNVEVISNNIANMTTAGYKRRRPEFQDLLYQNYRRIGASSSDVGTIVPTGVQIGLGVMPAAVYRIHEQGNMVATENPSISPFRAQAISSSSSRTARSPTPATAASSSARRGFSSPPTATP
jgi:flagellar hook-associated protein FlgK